VGGRPLQLPLLIGSERVVLIDSGSASDPDAFILPALEALGVPAAQLGVLINTHCDFDHQGGNAAIKRAAPNVLLCCGDADRSAIESPQVIVDERYDAYRHAHAHAYTDEVKAWIFSQLGAPQPVDLTFRGGERLRLGDDWEVEIVHLPGHSHGHIGVWDRKHNVLFGGDAIHGAVYLDNQGAPALCPTYLHVQPYLATIERIESLPLEGYVGCHWPVARDRGAIQAFCAESRAFVLQAEAALIAAISNAGSTGVTLSELCASVGPSLGRWPEPINHELCYAFAGHLTDLATRDVIREHRSVTPFRYTRPA
jgi:glyoxylase-like metal-dependent hydrolase (beta-lactamase superfamily II)